jgi:hypothetical protein
MESRRGLLKMPAKVRLEWNCMVVTNTLAYYETATITAVKIFILQALGVGLG